MSTAAELVDALAQRGWHIATAESLTGGQVCASLVDVPGASRVLRGGVVAYDTAVKASVLGVDAAMLAQHGAVYPDVAEQMASGVRRALATTDGEPEVGVSTTGVAGPDPADGQPVGKVFVGVSIAGHVAIVKELNLEGSRSEIRANATSAALQLALAEVIAHGNA